MGFFGRSTLAFLRGFRTFHDLKRGSSLRWSLISNQLDCVGYVWNGRWQLTAKTNVLLPVHLVYGVLACRVGAKQLPGVLAPSIATMGAFGLDGWLNPACPGIPMHTPVPVAVTATPRFRTRSALVHPPFPRLFIINYHCQSYLFPAPVWA